tara:strand:- start:250 stop:444 length:195 start_codon:yes stop_codon:yes gene_type:complete
MQIFLDPLTEHKPPAEEFLMLKGGQWEKTCRWFEKPSLRKIPATDLGDFLFLGSWSFSDQKFKF